MVFNVTVVSGRSACAFIIRHMHKLLSSFLTTDCPSGGLFIFCVVEDHKPLGVRLRTGGLFLSIVFSPKYEIFHT